jgi:hypothetical protein
MADETQDKNSAITVNEVKKSIFGEIAKFLVPVLLVLIGSTLYALRDSIETRAGATVLNFLSHVLTTDPEYFDTERKEKRPVYYKEAIINFQNGLTSFAKALMVADPQFMDRTKDLKRDDRLARSMHDFQLSFLKKFADIFTKNPDNLAREYPIFKDANNKEVVVKFQKDMYKNVTENRGLIGYVQTGTFALTSTSVVAQTIGGLPTASDKYPFSLFVGTVADFIGI